MRYVTDARIAKATPTSAKGSAKKRAASAKKEIGDDEEDAEATPTKKPRKTPAKKMVVAGPDVEDGPAQEEPGEEE